MPRRRLALALAVAACAAAACVASKTCPCGEEFTKDPLDPGAELIVGAEHDASVHCYCRCGDGPEERLPPSLTCEGYEGPCETARGDLARLTCR